MVCRTNTISRGITHPPTTQALLAGTDPDNRPVHERMLDGDDHGMPTLTAADAAYIQASGIKEAFLNEFGSDNKSLTVCVASR